MPTLFVLVPAMMLTAWVYASVGLGGGTAYLALLSFWSVDPSVLRPTAWCLNIVVSAVSFLNFYRQGHFDARLAWPFLVGGVLGASIGGGIHVGIGPFQGMLAITLIAASLHMLLGRKKRGADSTKRPPILPSLALGAAIGLVSGLVGIGGGIVLGPVLTVTGWAQGKTLAPITSVYILLCSLGALTSFLLKGGQFDLPLTGILCLTVALGGFAGSRWGAGKASESSLKTIFGLVALVAGIRLAYKFLSFLGG